MREGWEIRKAGDIFEMTDFVSNGSFASLRENVEYLDHPDYAVLVRLADYSNGFDSSKFVYVSKQSYDFLAKSKLFGGEIIMSNVGSVGKSFICPDLGCPMTIGPNAVLIRSKNNSFYQYYFQTEEFQRKLLSISSKATLLKFNKTNFKTLDIPVPSLTEQQHIVDILDREFAKIDALKANAEKSLQAAKDLFQATLNKEMKPKEGWEIKVIDDCFTGIKNGASIQQKKGASGIPITRIETLSGSVFNRDRLGYADIGSPDKYSAFILNDGDILMSHINSLAYIGRAVLYHKKDKELIIHGMNLLRLVPVSGIVLPPFAELYFKTEAFKWDVQGIANVSIHQASFNTKALKALHIPVPPIPIQEAIVSRLCTLNDKCKNLQDNYQKSLALCEDLKQALLRKAFNGEL